MPRRARWETSPVRNGIGEFRLFSWKYFTDFVYQEMLDFRDYIWRGQRCDSWSLDPTLDRKLKRKSKTRQQAARVAHLRSFQYAARGRRGGAPRSIEDENEWWAIGQHHGLHTPLLDWTASPFAAAYFAFVGQGPDQTRRRAIYAVDGESLQTKSAEIAAAFTGVGRPPVAELVRPLSDENPRLVSQAGLFTRSPDGVPLEDWIQEHFEGELVYIMIKVTIPNKDREVALRSLNRMNINHLSLFPDLYGASRFCNLDLEIATY